MKKSKKDFEDDGRTIADMSDLSVKSTFSLKKRSAQTDTDERPWENQFSREERRAAVLGALGASLAIGLCYILGFGALILLLVLIW